MKKTSVLYQGYYVNPLSVLMILKGAGYPERLLKTLPDGFHVTCDFLPEPEKIYPNDSMGSTKWLKLEVDAIGELRNDKGELTNLALRVVNLNDEVTANPVPHITCWVGNGGKPVDSWKCEFNKPISAKVGARRAVFDKKNRYGFKTRN